MQEGFQGNNSSAAADAADCLPVSLEQIVGEALRTYECRSAEELVSLLHRRYAASAEFRDPTIIACPRRELALTRYALQKVYSEVTVSAIGGANGGGAPELALVPQRHGPPLLQVAVSSWHRYAFKRSNHISQQVLPECAERGVTTRLLLDTRTGQVVRHEDVWAHGPAVRLPRAWRKLNCLCSNAVYRLLGWEGELRAAAARAPSWQA